MLTHLMAHGAAEEVAAAEAAGVPASPLFYTNRIGVLRGTHFPDFLFSWDQLADFMFNMAKTLVGINNAVASIYDFQLDHWGLNPNAGEAMDAYFRRIFHSKWVESKSNAMYDLKVEATRSDLLNFIKNSEDTYYFSFAGDTTFAVLLHHVARPDTNLFLQSTANLIGAYTNHTLFGFDSHAWRANDGLVPVVSSQGDDFNGLVPYEVNLFASTERLGRALAAR
ncbi:hypothetical protein HDU96_010000 [Phlyctochytrium bullatum]|nr:hypothetical protein HDU96_010000 [Phlyctochytrium bullatum]